MKPWMNACKFGCEQGVLKISISPYFFSSYFSLVITFLLLGAPVMPQYPQRDAKSQPSAVANVPLLVFIA